MKLGHQCHHQCRRHPAEFREGLPVCSSHSNPGEKSVRPRRRGEKRRHDRGPTPPFGDHPNQRRESGSSAPQCRYQDCGAAKPISTTVPQINATDEPGGGEAVADHRRAYRRGGTAHQCNRLALVGKKPVPGSRKITSRTVPPRRPLPCPVPPGISVRPPRWAGRNRGRHADAGHRAVGTSGVSFRAATGGRPAPGRHRCLRPPATLSGRPVSAPEQIATSDRTEMRWTNTSGP